MESKSENLCLYVRILGIYFLSLILGAMNIGIIGSLLKVIGSIPVAIWLIEKQSIYKSKLLTFVFLMVSWVGLSYCWSIEPAKTLQRTLTQCSFLLLLCSASTYTYNARALSYLKKCLIWSSRISAICTLIFADYMEGRLFLGNILVEDPNYLCAYFLFGIAFDLELLLGENETIRTKMIALCEIFIYFYIIIATGSRGGTLAVLMACLTFYVYTLQGRNISIRKFFSPIFAVIFLIIVYCIAIKFVSPDVLQRFSLKELAESNGTGRYTIWEDALSTYFHSGVFRQLAGYGSATAVTIAQIYHFRRINVFHNAFIENLLEIGFIGFLFYTTYIFRFWNCARKQKNIFAFSVMTGLIVLSLSTSIAAFKPYWNIILFIICTEYMDVEDMEFDDQYEG